MNAGVVQRLVCGLAKAEARVRLPSLAPYDFIVQKWTFYFANFFIKNMLYLNRGKYE